MFKSPRLLPSCKSRLAAALIAFAPLAGSSHAALILTFTEEAGNVVMRTSGSVDISNSNFVLDSVAWAGSEVDQVEVRAGISFAVDNAAYDYQTGVDLLAVDLASASFVPDVVTGAGQYLVSNSGFWAWDSASGAAILDNSIRDSNTFDSTREMTFNGRSFATMGLDAHALDTEIGLWAARAGATDAERINFIVSTGAAAVPEPSSTALLGLGGLALMLRRRR